MDVKSFIYEATDKALLVDEALKGVETAKEAVEAAKAAVETARAGVETAKAAVSAARDELETYAEQAETYGLTKAKFKETVDRMKTLLAEIGAAELSADAVETQPKPKAQRKRKNQEADAGADSKPSGGDAVADNPAEEAAAPAQPVETSEPVESPTAAEFPEGDETADADLYDNHIRVVDAVEVPIELAVNVTGPTPAAPADEAPAADASATEELDNSFAERELLDYVDELGPSDEDVATVLRAAVKVVSWYASNVAKAPLTTHPSPLTLAAVLSAEAAGYLPKEVQEAYDTALTFGGESLAAAISWFNRSLDLMAEGKDTEDFRFAPHPEEEATLQPEAGGEEGTLPDEPAEAVPEVPAIDAGDATPDEETEEGTIGGMQLFSSDDEPVEPEAGPAASPAPEPAVAPEKPVSRPPTVSKPAWLKQ